MEPWVVATSLIFIYLLVTIILGVVANKRMTVDMEDFLLYGRKAGFIVLYLTVCLLYTSPSPRDAHESRMPSSA